jgi:hypothetical protein
MAEKFFEKEKDKGNSHLYKGISLYGYMARMDGLNKNYLNELQQYVNEIERDKIVDQITLMKWIEKSHYLLTKISALFPLLYDDS